jgi:hypothetical protein
VSHNTPCKVSAPHLSTEVVNLSLMVERLHCMYRLFSREIKRVDWSTFSVGNVSWVARSATTSTLSGFKSAC